MRLTPAHTRLTACLPACALAVALSAQAAEPGPRGGDPGQTGEQEITAPFDTQHVLVTGFPSRTEAESAARRLERQGIPTRVIARADDYALFAGEFDDLRPLFFRIRELERLGFRDVYVVHGGLTATELREAAAREAQPPAQGREEFVFGQAATAGTGEPAGDALRMETRIPRILVETGRLTRSGAPADWANHATLMPRARWYLSDNWEFQATARLDALYQTGDQEADSLDLDYGDTFLRYMGDRSRVTAGTQTIIWGRMDALSPVDRLSTKDLRRFGLDELPDRRVSSPALRVELFPGDVRLDAVFLPVFREAELPTRDSVWHPVDRNRGEILGQPPNPALSVLAREGSFSHDINGIGGGGVRLTRDGRAVDMGFSVQRVRHSAPYFALNKDVRETLLLTGDPEAALASTDDDTFSARHPWTWVAGVDLGLDTGPLAWRAEAAWLSDVPATSEDLAFVTRRGVDWAVGADAFPGDGDLRLSMELAGSHLFNADDVIDRQDIYLLAGEVAYPLQRETWWARLRFSAGLDERDVYVNPELAYAAIPGQEIYLGYHFFDGKEGTAGGFLQDRDMAVIGWRGRF